MTTPNAYRIEMIQENNRDIREMRALRAERKNREEIEAIYYYMTNIANAKTAEDADWAINTIIVTDDGEGEMVEYETFDRHIQKAIKDESGELYAAYSAMHDNAQRLGVTITI